MGLDPALSPFAALSMKIRTTWWVLFFSLCVALIGSGVVPAIHNPAFFRFIRVITASGTFVASVPVGHRLPQ